MEQMGLIRRANLGKEFFLELSNSVLLSNTQSSAPPSPCWLSSEYSAELNLTAGTGTVVSCPIQGLACSPNKLLQCGPV